MATSNQDNAGSKQGSQSGSKQSDTSKRGFASMDPDQQREIASEGGRAAHEKGTAHEFTSEEARRAGSMSHKNDQGSKQSSTTGSGSRSGSSSGSSGGHSASRDDNERNERSGSRSGGTGGTGGSGSSKT